MFGVSPAFVLSGWGEQFTPAHYAEALDRVSVLGFARFQLEVFFPERLEEWLTGGSALVSERAGSLGLEPSQFVAHFLMPAFASAEALRSERGLEEMKTVIRILDAFPACSLVTVPIGPYGHGPSGAARSGDVSYTELERLFADKLSRMLRIVESSGRRLALEILPHCFLGGTSGLLRLLESIGSPQLGYNFDTGHAWACKEELSLIPLKLGRRIFGTHLCDNLGHENLSLRPGAGSVPWEAVMGSLLASGYQGSLDLEIRCPAAQLDEEYGAGSAYLRSVLQAGGGVQQSR